MGLLSLICPRRICVRLEGGWTGKVRVRTKWILSSGMDPSVSTYIYIFIAKFAKMALKMNLAATATRNVAARAENRPTW